MQRFSDTVALVTGASSGIGAATAKRLASEGASVYGIGRDTEGLATTAADIQADGGEIQTQVCDITSAQECQNAIAQCIQSHGRLDVLVNCAGRHVFRPLHTITAELWREDLATNLGGAFFLCQAAMPTLLEHSGAIVNVGSLASVEGQPYSATYCSAKHGLIGLTKSLAVEFAKSGVRVNALCPGGTNTPQISNVGAPEGADWDLILRSAGLRGMSEPEDIAAVIAFLASADAKAINGAVYMVDQGKTAG
ncbi:MAG: meso-butanediol dehydrogenase/(S,S)-butanediol dehydrogenase/diacetyl reductase [Bacteroidia bacterium]|jgi:meso-butanediol dehydrogenase/(S,S)-butanediol dehydrogenase/diacetyl reductase